MRIIAYSTNKDTTHPLHFYLFKTSKGHFKNKSKNNLYNKQQIRD